MATIPFIGLRNIWRAWVTETVFAPVRWRYGGLEKYLASLGH